MTDLDELEQYYHTARHKTPGEWEDAVNAILDVVPELIKHIRKQDAVIKKLLVIMTNNEDCPNYWDWSTGGYCHSFGAKCQYGECWEKAIQIEMEKVYS